MRQSQVPIIFLPAPGAAHPLHKGMEAYMIEVTFSQGAHGALSDAISKELLENGMEHEPYCLSLYLDVGRLEDDVLGAQRRKMIGRIHEGLAFGGEVTEEIIEQAAEAMREIPKHLKGAETLRIWYSDAPCELCDFVWFMGWLSQLPARGRVLLSHLPSWLEREDGTVVIPTSCAELEAADFPSLALFERDAPALMLAGMHFDWEQLKAQNADLRAVISGHVLSVPPDFYDFLIYECISQMPEVFPEALLIGNVLGTSQIRLSDGWLALRVAHMIEAGQLGIVEECADRDAPAYHRTLRKLTVR